MLAVVLAVTLTASGEPIDSPANIDRAQAICEHHKQPRAKSAYSRGWEACGKVRTKWLNKEAAKERQKQEQEKIDLEFVKSVAGAP